MGNLCGCIALARKRGVDVLLNKESKRETPTVASFSPKQRFLGTDGAGAMSSNIKNTVTNLKRLLGKKFAEPCVQTDIARLPFKVTEGPDGGCLINVNYLGENVTYTPEAVMGMILGDVKLIGERDSGGPITDCVISVPVYFTDAERHAMLDASKIAGLNCLRLMNDTAATALGYGIYKTDLPEDKPIHTVIVDAGEMALQVCVIALQKGKLRVMSSAWDRNLGGADFDNVIVDHFVDEIKATKKLDVRTNARAMLRLRLACEKLKKILSANPEAPLNVECIMEDQDVSGHLTREKFEELAAGIFGRVTTPLQAALEQAGLKPEDIDSVELVGGSSRVPALFDLLKTFFGKEPSRTMNAKECVSRGCALQCAMLSPIFRVREFSVEEAVPYTVNFTWEKEPGQPTTSAVFKRGDSIPSTKMLTFYKSDKFSLSADYENDKTANLPAGSLAHIGDFTIGPPIPLPADGSDKAKLKVKVHINLHGILAVESVQAVEETEVEVEPVVAEKSEAAKPAENGEASKEDGEAPMEADAAAPAADEAAAPAAPAEPKKSVKVTKKDVPFVASLPGLGADAVTALFTMEKQLKDQDRHIEATNEAKNALEGYVYDMRNKLYGPLSDFIAEDAKPGFSSQLDKMEDWLYDEGEDVSREVYLEKLSELKKIGDPVEERYNEMSSRGPAAESLAAACEGFIRQAESVEKKYEHISAEDKAKVVSECQAAMAWLKEKQGLQETMPKHEVPVLMTHDIVKKLDTVKRVGEATMNKPAPPPPKKEEPAKEAAADGAGAGEEQKAADSEPMDTDGAANAEAPAAEGSAKEEGDAPMET